MARSVQFAPDEFYHLYNRGTEKRDIFMDYSDKQRFILLLYMCNSAKSVELKVQSKKLDISNTLPARESLLNIGVYCLMPNHFHFLIRASEENGVSRFMHKLSTAYTMYFNAKYERTGSLFEGRFKARHVNNDRYLKYLIAYIHLNPIKLIDSKWKENGIRDKSAAQKFLMQYEYSSYLDYVQTRNPLFTSIIDKESFPKYAKTPSDFRDMVEDWLDYQTN